LEENRESRNPFSPIVRRLRYGNPSESQNPESGETAAAMIFDFPLSHKLHVVFSKRSFYVCKTAAMVIYTLRRRRRRLVFSRLTHCFRYGYPNLAKRQMHFRRFLPFGYCRRLVRCTHQLLLGDSLLSRHFSIPERCAPAHLN
jgi:hypothetical protein